MKSTWIKKGIIFKPDTSLYWQHSHAAVPTKMPLGGDLYRIFFASRDESQVTYIGWFDIDIKNPAVILKRSDKPVLVHGRAGMFDDCGVQPSSVVLKDNKVFLYYIGWSRGHRKEIFYTSIGLAISEDNGNTFTKYSESPIMERSPYDPWMVSGPCVLHEEGIWKMYYISGQKIEILEDGVHSLYDIRYAESSDGITWKREGVICLPLEANETNISRISILKTKEGYVCWYPIKKAKQGYRIGFAESKNGLQWNRKDAEVGIDVSPQGWDSEAIDKVEVIQHNGTRFMFYNGNQFGKDGIGLATSI